jgi:2-phosphoglycerate kinase
MAKLLVINSDEDTKVPFLRGILTRSLQDAGLDFEEAYDLASDVRDSLSSQSSIGTKELRERVAARLREVHGDYLANRYESGVDSMDQVMVRRQGTMLTQFSEDLLGKSLELSGIGHEEARSLSRMLGRHLVTRNRREISADYLGKLTYRMLLREVGKKAAHRYLVWRDFRRSGVPLLLLIGGAPGSGKSTIATALASQLDIFRTQSTDMLREVMRMMMPERLLPVLHRSSFEAWRALPSGDSDLPGDQDDLIATGYRSQTELLMVSCEAVVQRAVRERVSMVLEGVHIDPAMVNRLRGSGEIIVVPVVLAILKQDMLRKRIRGRGGNVPHRRAERYLKNFDAIWHLQSYLLAEADREKMPIIANEEKDTTVGEILQIIGDRLAAELEPTLKQVFPAAS